jgi:hypothetical protein
MPDKKILGVNVHYRNESTRMGKGGWIFWYMLWGGLTIVSLWFGVRGYFKEQAFMSRAELDTGTITTYELNVRNDGKSEYCPRIEFTTNAGEPVAVQGSECPNRPDDSKIGQTVQVYYDPQNPELYQEKSSTNGYNALIFGLIGAVFFGLFWIIPLLVAIFKRLTSSTTTGSDQASPEMDQELAMLEKLEKKYKR